MPLAAFVAVFLVPLALAPRLLFYYDISPKIALLLLSAAIAVAFTSGKLDSFLAFRGTRYGRWYMWVSAATIVLASITTLTSSHRSLSWYGSTWRRMGALTDDAIVLAALCIAAYTVRSPTRLAWLLRAMCTAGLLASIYGIAQYFGWDPILPKASYEVGEGVFQIVRPPSTMGHSDYFAAFLLWPVFAGISLFRAGRSGTGKVLARSMWAGKIGYRHEFPPRPVPPFEGVADGGNSVQSPFFRMGALAAASGMCAILLSGSRGAILALAAGLCVLAAMDRPRLRSVAKMGALAVVAIGVFYVSPAGGRLRARAHWIGEDRAGGARPLLWRDSLRMAAAKPLVGFGLDTFVADFPRYQSEELARAYPDFDHESPHNIFLDALTAEGLPGLLLLFAVIGVGLAGGWRVRTQALSGHSMLSGTFLPGLVASLVAHQFVVFVAPTAFYFYLGAGVLAGAGEPESVGPRLSASGRWTALASGLAAAGFLVVMAFRLVVADSTLALVDRRLDTNDAQGAADAYRKALGENQQYVAADLYFSRRWAAVAENAADANAKLYYERLALGAASAATKSPERQQNAWYNLAIFEASTGNVPAVEYSLRASIAVAPVWYKPRWALARLLAKEGRLSEAEPEARRALYLDGGKDAEVVSTLSELFGSATHSP